MKQGTTELIFLAIFFIILQFWWIRMTIKNGRTGEVDKWGRKTPEKTEIKIKKAKEDLEKIYRS